MLAKELLSDWPARAWQHRRLLVGVSGGADSVALLRGLCELGASERLVVAHYNHGWRGPASDADEAFVIELCRQLDVECRVERAHPAAASPQPPVSDQNDSASSVSSAMLAKAISIDSESPGRPASSEEGARNARYAFLIQSAYECGASYVVTAHTADDRVETLLHNLFRGAGLAGAASLRKFRELDQDLVLVRPLIAKSRKAVLQYLNALQQSYCVDASNSDERYARNYIRNHILPAVRVRYAEPDSSLLNFSELVEEAMGDICLLARRWMAAQEAEWHGLLTQPIPDGVELLTRWREQAYWGVRATAAQQQPWTVVREALRLLWLERGWPLGDLSRRHWALLRTLLASLAESPPAGPSPYESLAVLPGAIRVEAAYGFLVLGRPRTSPTN